MFEESGLHRKKGASADKEWSACCHAFLNVIGMAFFAAKVGIPFICRQVFDMCAIEV